MNRNKPPLKSFAGLGAWMDSVPPRTLKANMPDPALVEPLKALLAIPRADIIEARRARKAEPSITPARPSITP